MADNKQLILNHVTGLVADFLYYDRKEDEDLPSGSIERALINEDITVDEITDAFKNELHERLSILDLSK